MITVSPAAAIHGRRMAAIPTSSPRIPTTGSRRDREARPGTSRKDQCKDRSNDDRDPDEGYHDLHRSLGTIRTRIPMMRAISPRTMNGPHFTG